MGFALMAGGCMAQHTVTGESLHALRRGQLNAGVSIPAENKPWKARLGPQSEVRLVDGEGRKSRWLKASALEVSDDGVYSRHRKPVAYFEGAIVELDEGGRQELRTLMPEGGEIVCSLGQCTLRAKGDALGLWVAAFVEDQRAAIQPTAEAVTAQKLIQISAEQTGHWVFFDGDFRSKAYAGEGLAEVVRVGLPVKVGWPWRRVEQAEVRFLSGPRTLGAVIGTAALAVALAPAAFLARGLPIPGDGPRAGGSSGFGGRAVSELGGLVAGGGGSPSTLSRPGLEGSHDVPSHRTRRLFSLRERVGSVARFGLSTDISVAPIDPALLSGGVTALVRFVDLIELGGGFRRFVAVDGGRVTGASVGFAHLGLHANLDANNRLAIPLGVDIGGGERGLYVRLDSGLRWSVSRRWFLGLRPSLGYGDRGDGARRWNVDGALEVGFVGP